MNPAGGHRYRCKVCARIFIHGGPGRGNRLPAVEVQAFLALRGEGSSIRAAAAAVGISKWAGRMISRRREEAIHRQVIEHYTKIRGFPDCGDLDISG